MTNTKDDWADEIAKGLKQEEIGRHTRIFFAVELRKARIDGETIGELRGRIKGLREAAEVAGNSCWKHAGEDAYSQGMDAGAIHQAKACVEAIGNLADKLEKGET